MVLVVSGAISVPLFIDDCVGYFRVGLNSMGVVIVRSSSRGERPSGSIVIQ